MTIACCWLDDSYGRSRITAVADARVAVESAPGKWTPLNDTTTKLFRIPVSCFAHFDCSVGTWVRPYYSMDVGFAFAGYCLEAMSIAALFRQVVERLVLIDPAEGARPRPEPRRLVDLLLEITQKYFAAHQADLPVEFLLFGYSPTDSKPWVAQVVKKKGAEAMLQYVSYDLALEDNIWSIGDVGAGTAFKARVSGVRKQVRKRGEHRAEAPTAQGEEADLEQAKLRRASLKATERSIQEELENEFNVSVGGVLQKMEIYPLAEEGAVGVISRDNQQAHLLDVTTPVGDGLAYVPIVESMGKTPEEPGLKLPQSK